MWWKRMALLLLSIGVVLQMGCSGSSAPDATYPVETVAVHNGYIPFDTYADYSDQFQSCDTPPFQENVKKQELSLTSKSSEEYVTSSDAITVEGDAPELIVHATWNPQDATVFLGLQNVRTEDLYLVRLRDGSAAGKVCFSEIPNGTYRMILYSDSNSSTVVSLVYQML